MKQNYVIITLSLAAVAPIATVCLGNHALIENENNIVCALMTNE